MIRNVTQWEDISRIRTNPLPQILAMPLGACRLRLARNECSQLVS
ncbi:MAG: hypothetical protein PUP93_25910 [Rhizonema sp. NSF051]|nr:hypothetical protein [Rhizonema sp. NSF051]